MIYLQFNIFFLTIATTISLFHTSNAFHTPSPKSNVKWTFNQDENTNKEPHALFAQKKSVELSYIESATSRSTFLTKTLPSLFAITSIVANNPTDAEALVKGNAPPPKKSKTSTVQCTNVEECQEMADKKLTMENMAAQEALKENVDDNENAIMTTKKGTRYRDLVAGDLSNSKAVESGDTVQIYYKILKLGKRSYDGLSGEGTVVFSRGYGLEDDEDPDITNIKKPRKYFECTLGESSLITALSDAMPGMHCGTVRRISVSPQMGWEVPSRECDGGPGGRGAGGELKTDYVVVPTATMVSTESCFAKDKLPFPKSYAQQRRMAQRFDQSLIMEVELIKILDK